MNSTTTDEFKKLIQNLQNKNSLKTTNNAHEKIVAGLKELIASKQRNN